MNEESAPFGLVAENPAELRKPEFIGRVRRVPRSSVEDAINAYQQRHDLAAGLKGIRMPSVWILREGAEIRVCVGDRDLWRPITEVSGVLENFAETVLARTKHHAHARATSAAAHWNDRVPSKARLMTLRTGLDEQQLKAWAPSGKGIAWWGSPERESPMMAVARMSRSMSETSRRSAIAAVAHTALRATPVLDELTAAAGSVLEAVADRKPFEQGHALAMWLRARLNIAGPINPEELIRGWKVHLQDLPGVDRQLDAFACWGGRGPAIFVNPQGEHANSVGGRRATLAHEIAHLILDRGRSLPLAEMFGGATPLHLEKRACAFAAELLLPREVASSVLAKSTSLQAAAQQLQREYGVSREVVAWQIQNGTGMNLLDKKQRAQVSAWCEVPATGRSRSQEVTDGATLTAQASSSSTASSSSATTSSAVAMRMRKSKKQRTDLLPRAANDAHTTQISDRQLDVLGSLAAFGDWARPMDIGARDGSHHSATLSQLARHGLADRKKLHAIYCYNGSTQRQKLVDNRWVVTDGHPPSTACCCKGSCRYKITPAGRKAVGR